MEGRIIVFFGRGVALCRAAAVYFCGLILFSALTPAVEPARVAVDLARPISGYAIVDAFPGVTFNQPVAIVSPPGETNRLFVVERAGVVCVITNLAAPNRSVFLDLRTNTYADNIESGLLGLAFHPNFRTNGQFFVFRTINDRNYADRLSRFAVSGDDPNRADPTETILINQIDVNSTHNAGDLHFGPDGYLYISVGDDGPTLADRRELPQAIDGGLFGGILRIDVDQRPGNPAPHSHPSVVGNYSIPADNPFIGATTFLGSPVNPERVRTEFFAVGMRNPWRFTIDSQTGDIVAGDVGLAWAEEIDLVTSGGNYGWPFWEGLYPGFVKAPVDFEVQWPLHVIERGNTVNLGSCVIGGIVCRNISIPDLEGWYIFGDEGSGNIWKLRIGAPEDVEWIARESGIAAFGRDPATGDVLFADLTRGEIRRLVYAAPEEQRIPTKLSATGIFANLDSLTPSAGLVPYEINVPFWSDNAIKRRWFGLMNGESKVGFSPIENWTFPDGAVWVKHFDLEMEHGNPASARRVETRLLVKSGDQVYGFTYQWDQDGRDATLVGSMGAQQTFNIKDPDGQIRSQTWIFPPRGDCVACHSKGGGGPLGFNTAQLNLDHRTQDGATKNQLAEFLEAGYLDAGQVEPGNLPALAKATDTAQPLEYRVKSYLAANCSQCHRPDGIWGTHWDARWTTPMSQSQIVNVPALPFDTNDWRIVSSHSPDLSAMFWRISNQDMFRMPPIASNVLDEDAGNLLREWILGLPDEAFREIPIGSGTLSGSVTQSGKTRAVSGVGPGMVGSGQDRLHLLGGPIQRGGHILAHLSAFNASQPSAKAGLMIRESADSNSAAVWFARTASGATTLSGRAEDNANVSEISTRPMRPWIRLVRNADKVTAWDSADGIAWEKLGETDFVTGAEAIAGVAAASGEDWRYATAEFDEMQTVSVAVRLDDPAPNALLPHDVAMEADVSTNGVAVTRVDFYAQGELIGSASSPPWRISWTNAWAGTYPLVATAIDQNGLSVNSEAAMVTFTASPTICRYVDTIALEDNWRDEYASIGAALPAISTNLPARAGIDLQNASAVQYDARGLLNDGDLPLPASAWISQTKLDFTYRPGNELAHRLTIFLAPYENSGDLKITIRDLASGAQLDQRTISDYADGRFVCWVIRGDISFSIESVSGGVPHVSGIMLAPLPPPTVTMQPVGSPVELPNSILLEADASAQEGEIARVEFWDGNTLLGQVQQAPYEFAWTNALAGQHQLTAVAVDEFDRALRSEPVSVVCSLPKASAVFFGEDRKTQGDWIGIYGNGGNLVPDGWTNLPSPISSYAAASPFLFQYPASDVGSLRLSLDVPDRLASCYFVNAQDPLVIHVAANDGKKARLALYFLDWFGPGRAEQIDVFDDASGVALDRQTVTSFDQGTYLVWNFEGAIRIELKSLNDYNTIVTGIFLDAPERFSSFWFRQNFPKTVETEAKWFEDSDGDGRPNIVEYAFGTDPTAPDSPLSIQSGLNGDSLTIDLAESQAASDVAISVETSTDLLHWRPETPTRSDSNGHIQLTAPISDAGAQFYRLRFELL